MTTETIAHPIVAVTEIEKIDVKIMIGVIVTVTKGVRAAAIIATITDVVEIEIVATIAVETIKTIDTIAAEMIGVEIPKGDATMIDEVAIVVATAGMTGDESVVTPVGAL